MTAAEPRATLPASEILRIGRLVLEQRGRDRDQPAGERSMPAVVTAFNALTGHQITEQQGWLLLALVKVKRSQTGRADPDHYVDGCNYIALAGESALAAAATNPMRSAHEHRFAGEDEAQIERTRDCPSCERTGLLPGSGGSSTVACPACDGLGEVTP